MSILIWYNETKIHRRIFNEQGQTYQFSSYERTYIFDLYNNDIDT